MNSSKIYIFSGLGVDQRVFDNIDFSDFNVEFVDWISPLRNEPLENYVQRISKKISDDNPILIGLSFGGMVSVEISKILKVKKVILIASAKNKNELPLSYRILGQLRVNSLIPVSILKSQNFVTNWLFGVSSPSEKQLLKNILEETDSIFLKWALKEIALWKNTENPKNYIHIHGNRDRIIPMKNVKVDYVIKNGGHSMTVNKAKEIEVILKKVLSSI